MTDLKDLIKREIDQYMEWPTADKSYVTTVSAKLFAEHVARLYADHIPDAGKMVAPAVQGEAVGWQFYQHGKWWYGDDRIKDHRKNTEEAGFRVRDVYAAPQPAEQQPAPDVAGLVEALDLALEYWRDRQKRYKNRRPKWVIAAESALAAHRKGGDQA